MSLANSDEPLKLADGTLIYPDRVERPQTNVTRLVEIPRHDEAREIVLNTRRKLTDLPEIPRNLNAISVILSYSLFGLDDDEIAVATNLTLDQIANIRSNPVYETMHASVIESILGAEANQVKDIFVQNSRNAARKFVDALHDGNEITSIQLQAASQVLDRAGMRPADIVEHRSRTDNTLNIVIVRKDDTKQAPTIDLEL